VATIGVGDTPRGIANNASQHRVYVANYGSNSLSVIDSSNNLVIQTVTGITSATGVAYDPHHDLVWVTNYDSDQVTPIDASSLAPLPSIAVGNGPWGIAYDPVHDYVYVVNSEGDSVTVLDAETRVVSDTLSGAFNQPFHAAANPVTGKLYVTNFGDHSVAVVNGTLTSVVNLNVGNPSTQPYGVAVDETRDLVYVATVDSHRLVVLGTDAEGNPDRLVGWAALHRGFGDPTRPVPLRVIAVNPDIGPVGDGGHVWATTGMADGSEANQVLLIPKGWDGYFDYPSPYDLGANPSEGIAVDRISDRVYVSNGLLAGTVTVLGDSTDNCLVPFDVEDGLMFEMSVAR
jgi:YVTN family beta-propeller protein